MIDKKALYAISVGMYVFTTTAEGKGIGRLVDAVSQVSAEPKRVSVSLMKTGFTSQYVAKGGRFALTVLSEDAPMSVIEAFGYKSSADTDKFAGLEVESDEAGCPYVLDGAISLLSCEIFDVLDMGSHILVLGEVTEAKVFTDKEPMTYAQFRKIKAGQKAAGGEAKTTVAADTVAGATPAAEAEQGAAEATPEEATTDGEVKYGWRCMICGHIEMQDPLPDDFVCPLCGMGKSVFERIQL